MAKLSFYRNKKPLIFLVTFVLVVTLSAVLFPSLPNIFNYAKNQDVSESESQRNLDLIDEALEKQEPSICNQIEGGILEKKSESKKHESPDGTIVAGDELGHPAMNEEEARAKCLRVAERFKE